ncbi:MAG: hypothetical protein JSR28_09940 [Proteobacteria bacterium]|nr:hypothetical protein [Pseudomonadota bacterium]MDE2412861.1 hypothetical protein [Sphingomonadales bacterium]
MAMNEPGSEAERQRVLGVRRAISVVSLILVALALWVFATGHIRISGKHSPAHVYTGAEARAWAGLLACSGIAVLGVWLRTPARIGIWMGLWLMAGIAIVLVPAFIHA